MKRLGLLSFAALLLIVTGRLAMLAGEAVLLGMYSDAMTMAAGIAALCWMTADAVERVR